MHCFFFNVPVGDAVINAVCSDLWKVFYQYKWYSLTCSLALKYLKNSSESLFGLLRFDLKTMSELNNQLKLWLLFNVTLNDLFIISQLKSCWSQYALTIIVSLVTVMEQRKWLNWHFRVNFFKHFARIPTGK